MALLNNGLSTIETGQQDARTTINNNFSALDQYRYRSGAFSARPAGVGAYEGQLYLSTSFAGGEVGALLQYWSGSGWVTVYSTRLRTDTDAAPAMEVEDGVVLLDASIVSLNVTLLPANNGQRAAGVPITFKRIDNSLNLCNINRAADRKIDGNGSGSYPLASQYDSVALASDGVDNYNIVAEVVN